MNTLTRRATRLALLTVGFAGLFVAVNAGPAAATMFSEGFVSTPLGHGKLSSGSLSVNPGLQIVVSQNDVAEGASSGWHSHPGGAIVVVAKGQITTYRSVRSDQGEGNGNGGNFICIRHTYIGGESFIENPGEPLIAVNRGPGATLIFATFPGLPLGTDGKPAPRTDVSPNPGTCLKKFGV